MSQTPTANDNCIWIQVSIATIKQVLDQYTTVLLGQPHANLYFSDDSIPNDNSAASWRCMPVPRLHLMLTGTHTLYFVKASGITQKKLEPGDIWFYPADAHDNETFSTPCSYLAIIFYETITRFVLVENTSVGSGKYKRSTQWVHWKKERLAAIDQTLESLLSTIKLNDRHAGLHLANALWWLNSSWLESPVQDASPLGKAHASWLTIDRFIQENYHRPINRESVSRAIGLHPNRISTLCRKYSAKSFQQILEERRIRQAKRFLENSGHKIETISVLCGYTSAPYFSRVFVKTTGMTPGQWRLNYRKILPKP